MTSKPQASKPQARRRTAEKPAAQGGDGRNDILKAALTAFARDSFDGASLPDIARQAGIGAPLIHYHFGSKENLWRETVDYAFREITSRFNAIALASKDLAPVDCIKLYFRMLLRFSADYPEHVLVIISEMRQPGERLTWVTEKYLRQIHNHIDSATERAVALGQIRPVPSVYLTNTVIHSAVQFYASAPLMKSLYDVDPGDPDIATEHADWLVDILFNGISVPSMGSSAGAVAPNLDG
jgi:AcrR family transcriptional regulator